MFPGMGFFPSYYEAIKDGWWLPIQSYLARSALQKSSSLQELRMKNESGTQGHVTKRQFKKGKNSIISESSTFSPSCFPSCSPSIASLPCIWRIGERRRFGDANFFRWFPWFAEELSDIAIIFSLFEKRLEGA